MTNYDRIQQMSIEEMASALIAFKDCNCNCLMSKNKKHCYLICDNESVIKKWLEQEVEE